MKRLELGLQLEPCLSLLWKGSS